jgi:hypothetical protein
MKQNYFPALKVLFAVIITYCMAFSPGLQAQNIITIGTGTGSNSGSTYPTPYGNWYWGNRVQMIYRASELTAAGASAGTIFSIAFNVTALNAVPALNDFEIKIKNSMTNDLSAAFETGMTTVYTSNAYTPTMGWNIHTFTTPFVWDGVSNLIVEVCSQNTSYLSNGNASTQWTENLPTGTSRTYRADAAGVCANTATSNLSPTYRPNAQIAIVSEPCGSVPLNLQMDSVDANGNATLSWMSPGDGWILEFGPCGFTPGQGQATFADSNVVVNSGYVMPGLTLGSCGCVYIKEDCDTVTSGWSDSIEICNPYTLDAEMRAILSPVSYQCGVAQTQVIIEIRNNGINPMVNRPVQVAVTGDYTYNFNVTGGGMAPGQIVQYTVGNFNAVAGGVVDITAISILPGDQFPDNDTVRETGIIIRTTRPLDFDVLGFGNLEVGFVSSRRHDTVSWDFGGLGTANGDSVVFTFPQVDTFEVCMEVISSCGGGTLCKMVYANTVSTVDWDAFEKRVSVYPNPTKGIFQVNAPALTTGHWSMTVTNSTGQDVMMREVKRENETFDLSHLAKGIYFIKLNSDRGTVYRRIILQ